MAKEKKEKKNTFLYILKLPFLGIFYVVDFFIKILNWEIIGIVTVLSPLFIFLEYVSLGCYYTLYGILYPFIFIFTKIGDLIFKLYSKTKSKNIDIKEIAPLEEIKLDTSDSPTEENTSETQPKEEKTPLDLKEYFKKKYEEFYFVKKQKEKEEQQINALFESLQKDNLRSEKPVVFKYVAKDPAGKKVSNIFIAFSKMEVYSFLQNEGYKVLSIKTSDYINFIYNPKIVGNVKLKNKDIIFWLTQLSTYLKSGIPLTEAMRILGKQMSSSPKKKRLFDSIIYNLTLGESFSSALSKQGSSFPALLISMIKTAEATGELEATLDDMAEYYTDIENTRKAMINAMTYPVIVSLFSVAVVTFIMLYVIPQFSGIYESAGAELNPFTLFIISASTFLEKNIIKILIIIVAIVLILIFLYRNVKEVKIQLQTFAMKLPLFGKIIIYKEMSVFAKTFSSLLKNNVFITDSMNLLSDVTNNEIYKKIMYRTVYYIAKGDKISTAFYNHWAVPEVAYYMIVTGESTGELAQMMSKVAEYYQVEHKTLINNMKAFIEPAMIIFLAVVVGGIVMAVILPMFGLLAQIQ